MHTHKILLSSLLLSSSAAVNAELLHLADTGFIIKNSFETSASRETTWRTFVDNVGDWWPSDHTWWGDAKKLSIDEFAGGCFCEKSGTNSAEHMRISFVEQHKLLRMTGGLGPLQGMGMHGSLDWSFRDTESGKTQVVMKYTVNGISPEGFEKLAPIVDTVQGMQLNGLRIFIENSQ